MNKISLLALSTLVLIATACNEKSASNPTSDSKAMSSDISLSNHTDSLSYAWGMNLGSFLKNNGYDAINAQVFAAALDETMKENPEPMIPKDQVQVIISKYERTLKAKQAEQNKMLSAKYREEGARFAAENGKKEGVVTLPNGLQYKIIKEGNGPVPQVGQTVVAHYRGTLLDGTQFDSSYDRNEPFEFAVGKRQVIPGWDQAFQLMPKGSKWTLYIPADLAYGDNPRPGVIKAGMTLIFDVELIDIK